MNEVLKTLNVVDKGVRCTVKISVTPEIPFRSRLGKVQQVYMLYRHETYTEIVVNSWR